MDINIHNDSHAEIAIAAAKAGKHMLCEKPLPPTVEDGLANQRVLAAVEESFKKRA